MHEQIIFKICRHVLQNMKKQNKINQLTNEFLKMHEHIIFKICRNVLQT